MNVVMSGYNDSLVMGYGYWVGWWVLSFWL